MPESAAAASAVMMVRPAAFGFNAETAGSNRFQHAASDAPAAVAARARSEFDAMVAALRGAGVRVLVAEDTPAPVKPDAIFPNNWVSFHADGSVVLYPMQAPNRRPERRRELLDQVCVQLGFGMRRLIDLTHHEAQGRFLEGTGSLVLDHRARVAYACRSPRTDALVLREWSEALGYRTLLFDALDAGGTPYYHTNVMLAIGARAAVVALSGIDTGMRGQVREQLQAGGRELIEIDAAQVDRFAGNLLELQTRDATGRVGTLWALSAIARDALRPSQRERLGSAADALLALSVPTIETIGGGSVRCMLAEVPDTHR
ncbi:MAG TPA: arginine deiminase-related protein [Steroidobacteraceae bacterium]|nr:arginine deiminase-related protein [Steroidobacteraceae bacterium]